MLVLDLLPLALENDDGIKAANLNYEAALESEKASRSGLYPTADITVNHAEQDDSKPTAVNGPVQPTGIEIENHAIFVGFWRGRLRNQNCGTDF